MQQENTLNMRDPPRGTSPKIIPSKAGCGIGHGARWLEDEHASPNNSRLFFGVAKLDRK